MNKVYTKYALLAVVIFLVALSLTTFVKEKSAKSPTTGNACFKDKCFIVEIADNIFNRQQGLMFRTSLDKDKGMLFVFDKENQYTFWMKNTLIPLDIIWINQNREIVFIKNNALPCLDEECPLIKPAKPAKYVLEINSGISEGLDLKEGDMVYLDLDK